MARGRFQQFVQEVLEEEVTALVGRSKSERRLVGFCGTYACVGWRFLGW